MRFGVPMRIVAAAVVLALALVGLVVREGMARAEGEEVMLAITGYDPRSLLTGHYVQFQIREDLPPGIPCPAGADGLTKTPKGWVALKRMGDHHVAAGGVTSRMAARQLGDVAVRGTLTCLGVSTSTAIPGRPADATSEVTSVNLDLGVNRLHVDQARAEAMQLDLRGVNDAERRGDYAIISVGRDGKARLKGLIVAGKRTDLDWF